MTGHPASRHLLTQALRACARGIYPDEAAVELIIAHGTFLHRDDFTKHIITGEYRHCGSMTAHAAIDWIAATIALTAGALPCSGGEKRILRLAASLAAGLPADLRDTLTGLDDRNLALVIDAFRHASGQRPKHLGSRSSLVQRSYRILHTAGKLVRGGRRRQLKIPANWPWADAIATAWTRITALPQAP